LNDIIISKNKFIFVYFSFTFLSFSAHYENPFPALIDKQSDQDYFPGPSIFNLTIVKPDNASRHFQLIFNMDILSQTNSNGLEFTTYKPTPALPVETVSLILGRMNCRQDTDSSTIKVINFHLN